MIKLIASDMDGTLLDDDKNLPADFFEVLDELERRDIVFTVASGRTYTAVDHLFPEEYRSKIAFICDNGACTYLKGKPVNVNALDRQVFEELLDACEKIGGFRVVVCAEGGVYHLKSTDEFSEEVGRFYRNHVAVEDLHSIKDTVFKVAVCDERGTLAHGKPELDRIFGDKLNVQVSGEIWMDVMTAGVSKGKALRELMKTLSADRSETMAFGDYFNDADMLTSADWSFCMENGHEEVKKLCRFVAPDNNSGGVTQCIRKYVLDGGKEF